MSTETVWAADRSVRFRYACLVSIGALPVGAVLAAIAVVAQEPRWDARTFLVVWGLVVLGAVIMSVGFCLVWSLTIAQNSYVLTATELVVRRGDRETARISLSEVEDLFVDPPMDGRSIAFSIVQPPDWPRLHVRVRGRRTNRALPPVMIWGRSGTLDLEDRVERAVRAARRARGED